MTLPLTDPLLWLFPAQEIKITGCTVYVDPYKELVEEEAKAEAEAAAKVRSSANHQLQLLGS